MRTSSTASASAPHRLIGLLYVCFILAIVAILATPYNYLAVLPGLAILALAILIRYPRSGYYFVLFLIPFGAHRALGTPLGLVRLHWLVAAVIVLGLALQQVARRRLHGHLKTTLWPLLALFTVASVVSTCLSPNREVAIRESLLVVVAWLFVAISLVFVSGQGFRRTLPALIGWSVGLSSLLAVLGYFFRVPGLVELTPTGEAGRAAGGSTDPNQLAVLIAFAAPFIVHKIVHDRGVCRRVLNVGLLAICLAALVSTFSRSGAIIFGLTALLMLAHHTRRLTPRHLGFITLGVPVAIVVLAVAVPRTYWERQRSVADTADRSIGRRASYLDVGYEALKQRPLFGHGPGAFSEIYARSEHARRYTRNPESYVRDAHNTYVEVLVGTGIVGALIYLAILWRALRDFRRAQRRAEQQGETGLAALIGTYQIAFIALLLFIALISNFFNKHLLLTLALSQVALRITRPASPAEANEELPAA